MKHDFIDKHSNLNSLFHRLDPRTKLLLSFSFLILVALSHNIRLFPLYIAVAAISMMISRVPLRFYLKKLLIVTPLVVVLAFFIYLSHLLENKIQFSLETFSHYHPIIDMLAILAAKIYLSILVITLLISCTRFNDLLWSLRKFKLPTIVTTLSRLVYTYIFVFVDELHRTLRAYRSRTPVLRMSRVKLYGSITASIFLRSLARSDYIYKAMISRGFNGEFPEGNRHHLKWNDLAALIIFLVIAVSARLLWNI